ncbi:MAG: DUF1501 domain-containing protein [Aquabacterium sp.]|nr:DUF1501 domain-containing protein [Aquabacterium sp.]
MTTTRSRRGFLQDAFGFSALGAAAPLGLNLSAVTQAAAQSAGPGYRALVCVFMSGGNDAFNTVLATDTSSWSAYTTQRKPSSGTSIALMPVGTASDSNASGSTPERLGGVLPIGASSRAANAGRTFALHPALAQLQQMHQDGRVAVLANVGPLTRPTTKTDWNSALASKPVKLFSHNDQSSTWQAFKPEGAGEGWAGLMGDVLMGLNGQGRNATDAQLIQRSFTCMTPTSLGVWMAGHSVRPYQSSLTDVAGLGRTGKIYDSARLQAGVAAVMGKLNTGGSTTVSTNSLFGVDHQAIVQRALQASDMLGSQLAPLGTGPWSTNGATNAWNDPLLQYVSPVSGATRFNQLALQLQMVARLIDTNRRASLGINRQFFMVNLSGFDTHSGQIAGHAEVMAQLNHAMAYFDRVLGAMPAGDMRSQVTTFTASEFGRTFTSNGDGTDHGWGGHHLIMGGAVIGTEVYGTFPTYSTANTSGVFSSPDQIQNGVLIPTTSVDQYAYTLGKWMGVSDSNLRSILPNLSQFNSSSYDLGFMRA